MFLWSSLESNKLFEDIGLPDQACGFVLVLAGKPIKVASQHRTKGPRFVPFRITIRIQHIGFEAIRFERLHRVDLIPVGHHGFFTTSISVGCLTNKKTRGNFLTGASNTGFTNWNASRSSKQRTRQLVPLTCFAYKLYFTAICCRLLCTNNISCA